ncbi:MAG: DUF1834 family protein [Desulfobacteraceae bacterium]|nr:DUF1834 family protein [Desulfobacteraceae bacterium]
MYRVDEIEDAILATLQADATLSGYVRQFLVMPSLDEERLKTLLTQFPAIGVIAQSGDYSYAMSAAQDETGTFAILCFNRNLRSPVAALRSGAGGEKGIWEIVEDCRRAILANPALGLTGVDCLGKRRQLIFAGESFATASLEVEARWRYR